MNLSNGESARALRRAYVGTFRTNAGIKWIMNVLEKSRRCLFCLRNFLFHTRQLRWIILTVYRSSAPSTRCPKGASHLHGRAGLENFQWRTSPAHPGELWYSVQREEVVRRRRQRRWRRRCERTWKRVSRAACSATIHCSLVEINPANKRYHGWLVMKRECRPLWLRIRTDANRCTNESGNYQGSSY